MMDNSPSRIRDDSRPLCQAVDRMSESMKMSQNQGGLDGYRLSCEGQPRKLGQIIAPSCPKDWFSDIQQDGQKQARKPKLQFYNYGRPVRLILISSLPSWYVHGLCRACVRRNAGPRRGSPGL